MNASSPVTKRSLTSINPTTGEVLERFDVHGDNEVQRRLELASRTFLEFRKTTFMQRAAWLNEAAEILERDKSSLGRTMTLEMGKLLRAAVQEVEKCAAACRYY